MKQRIFYFLSLATGISIATVHLTQPLLAILSSTFGVSPAETSWIPSVTQFGYAAGLFTIVPLGDLFSKKKLILIKLSCLTVLLFGAGFVTEFKLFLVIEFFVGFCATAAQDFVPLATELADEKRRGQFIGLVLSGLILGVVFSRLISGFLAVQFGWTSVFFFSSGLVFLLLLATAKILPANSKTNEGTPFKIYASMLRLIKEERAVRIIVLRHGLISSCFAAFWSSLTFLMSAAPFGLRPSQIGQISLAGVVSAIFGSTIGKYADRNGPNRSLLIGAVLVFLASISMFAYHSLLIPIVIYALLIELGYRASLVTNQTAIYTVKPQARSRLNGILMGSQFLFFALASQLSGVMWQNFGWPGVSSLCIAASLLSIIVISFNSNPAKATI